MPKDVCRWDGFSCDRESKRRAYTTIINWVKQVGKLLPSAYDSEIIPEVGELDELQTFVGSKKTKSGCGQQYTTLDQVF
jgi:hypothetical protein